MVGNLNALTTIFPHFGGLELESGAANLAWSENMATNLDDRITGVL